MCLLLTYMNFPRDIYAILWLIFPKKGLAGGSWLELGESSHQTGIFLIMTGKGGIEGDIKTLFLPCQSFSATGMKHAQLSSNWNSRLHLNFYLHWGGKKKGKKERKKRAEFCRNNLGITTSASGAALWIHCFFMPTTLFFIS